MTFYKATGNRKIAGNNDSDLSEYRERENESGEEVCHNSTADVTKSWV
jgi:hypothetical protein